MILRDPPHYLKALTTTRTPKRLLWLDCAHETVRQTGMFVDRWRAGALGSTHSTVRTNRRIDSLDTYSEALALWTRAADFCTSGRRVVLFAHDLAYQLRVSQALVHLPALGFHLDKIVLERTASWALLRDGDRTLMCCDLQAWAPVDLATIAADLGTVTHVESDHPEQRKWQRAVCAHRAEVIREAVLQIFAWMEGENLGPFRPTGSGQSYAAFRRRFMAAKILVHDDSERLELERASMWTGRCEAWQHGKLTDGPYIEHDMRAAYCQIAAECEVPVLATSVMSKPSPERLAAKIATHAVLADVTVSTTVPVVPTRVGERTVWPVGTFRTLLWDPELALAATYCKSVICHRAWTYQRAPALEAFSRWVLDGLGGQEQVYGPIPKRVLKHWSRCLVGRLGLRYRSWELFGTSPTPDLRLVTYVDSDEGVMTDMLCAGHDRFLLAAMSEATESVPQVPAWVMSECRRRLWQAMVDVGLENIVYIDTDSMILAAGSAGALPAPEQLAGGGHWTRKGTYKRMEVHGPRNYTAENNRHVAGLPLSARQLAPLEFSGQVMRSIKESMRAGELDCVASTPRTFHFHTPDLRRDHLPYGATAPFHIGDRDA